MGSQKAALLNQTPRETRFYLNCETQASQASQHVRHHAPGHPQGLPQGEGSPTWQLSQQPLSLTGRPPLLPLSLLWFSTQELEKDPFVCLAAGFDARSGLHDEKHLYFIVFSGLRA